eukprot:CAMPEP_0183741612 /NCGR_PEP_ID=MMETSP0737-20130205/62605_1 /TAXON_ID=385413 /ORGANISM="Thalassiosira miniscula, Strain CCMP1093" /LENGTH=686 /DNA_ID=CAMNT_0025977005 /DNA_START=69 /DNA_END=2126 /DNA_ORIENTATION=+
MELTNNNKQRRLVLPASTYRSVFRTILAASVECFLLMIYFHNRIDLEASTSSAGGFSLHRDHHQQTPATKNNGPKNMHAAFPVSCDADFNASEMIGLYSYQLYDIINGPREVSKAEELPTNFSDIFTSAAYGHSKEKKGTVRERVYNLARLQTCLYESIGRFNRLAQEHGITRWAAHGGSAMSAVCSHSMNLWDDDIDVTIDSCVEINRLYDSIHDVIDSQRGFNGKLLPGDDGWLLYKKRFKAAYRFKLKPRSQFIVIPNNDDVSGLDIMCFDEGISLTEVEPLNKSGFREYLKGDGPLHTLPFGPATIQSVPHSIVYEYVSIRYGKKEFCDFPFDQSIPKGKKPSQQRSLAISSQMEAALNNWYIPFRQRAYWATMVGAVKGQELTKNIPNLDSVEVENSISRSRGCSMLDSNSIRPLKAIAFNAERGKHWPEFVAMIREMFNSSRPDIIILNEMDVGMARSGNVHTARKVAFELGMNYAWGLEYVELTNGNGEEQHATMGMNNELGLHGNAILSTCQIFDPLIVRDPLNEKQFSTRKLPINARGTEIRLGGRMGLFVRIGSRDRHLIVGSVHKISPGMHTFKLKTYFNITPHQQLGILAGGDVKNQFCASVALNVVGDQQIGTWKADCAKNITGTGRGDIFCTDMDVFGEDKTILPCYKSQKDDSMLQISDHSIIKVDLKSNW